MTNPNALHSIEAERAVLGAVLIDDGEDAWTAVRHLGADDFWRPDHRAIYAAMAELAEDEYPMDVVTVSDRLAEKDAPDGGWLPFLGEIVENTPGAVNAGNYARIVRERASRRHMQTVLHHFVREVHGPELVEVLAKRMRVALDDVEASRVPVPAWETTTADALIKSEDESLDWLVDGLLPAGGTSLMVGAPKSGKSSLARLMASKVVTGAYWHGHKTTPGPALYVALDERRSTVREHVRELVNGCEGDEAKKQLRDRLHVAFGPRPAVPVAALRSAVERIRPAPVLVVVDTLMKVFAFEDANDYGATGETMAAVTALAHETGAHFLLVHHARKESRDPSDPTIAALGSTRLAADVDVVALVRLHDKRRQVSFIGRDGVNVANLPLDYDERNQYAPGRPSWVPDDSE